MLCGFRLTTQQANFYMYYGRVLMCGTSGPETALRLGVLRPPRVRWQQDSEALIHTGSRAFGMADTTIVSVFLYSFRYPLVFNSNALLELEQTKKPGKHSRRASDSRFIITAHHVGTLTTTRLSA